MFGKFEKQARPFSLLSASSEYGAILKSNAVDELIEHRITSSIDVFCKRQVDLPRKSPEVSKQIWNLTFESQSYSIRRLDDGVLSISKPLASLSPCSYQDQVSNERLHFPRDVNQIED